MYPDIPKRIHVYKGLIMFPSIPKNLQGTMYTRIAKNILVTMNTHILKHKLQNYVLSQTMENTRE